MFVFINHVIKIFRKQIRCGIIKLSANKSIDLFGLTLVFQHLVKLLKQQPEDATKVHYTYKSRDGGMYSRVI